MRVTSSVAARWSSSLALASLLLATTARAEMPAMDPEPPPTPSVTSVDYEHPEAYLQLPSTMGSREAMVRAANQAGIVDKAGGAPLSLEERVKKIQQWVRTTLKADKPVYKWRNVDQIVADRTYNGNGELGLVVGAMLRVAGVPVVFVKTLSIDWIRDYKRDPAGTKTWKENVFLELYSDGRWSLLDLAPSYKLYRLYDHSAKVMPGPAWVYDKGGDPFALPLPARWQMWREQAKRFLAGFNPAGMPPGPEQHWWGESPDGGAGH